MMRNWWLGIAFVASAMMAVVSTAHADLNTARRSHTATLLPSGKVLVVGGWNGAALASAELYDPATGTSTFTGSLATTARTGASGVLLPSGFVLVTGGQDTAGTYLSSAELYDPATGAFTATTGSLGVARRYHTATLLASGKVLFVGGKNESGYLTSAELYDPDTGTFADVMGAELVTARCFHTATLLPSGRVLVAGGNGDVGRLSSAELYDPATGFSATGSMSTVRLLHSAALLPSGLVLMAGGFGTGSYLNTAELYDPSSGTFAPTGALGAPRYQHLASLLPSGRVLVAGGYSLDGRLASVELYDAASGTFASAPGLATARHYHSMTVLPSGSVLVVGGSGNSGYLESTEVLDSALPFFGPTGPVATGRAGHTATLLPSGKVLVAGGDGVTGRLSSAELFDPVIGTATGTGDDLAHGRAWHTATLLPSGEVLLAGGYGSGGVLGVSELFSGATDTFTDTGGLNTPRAQHTATLLPSGGVLMAGGEDGTNPLGSAEVYDPASASYSGTGSLAAARTAHTATLLPSGTVLVAGGSDATGYSSTAEIYDPTMGTFFPTGSLAGARMYATATLLPSGKVLVAGGEGSGGAALATAELYDPTTGVFTPTGSLITARRRHTATRLHSGRVLVAGGQDDSGVSLDTAEVYDPARGVFTSLSTPLGTARHHHTATLLPAGGVYLVGGLVGASFEESAETCDEGLGYQAGWRPFVTSVTAPAVLGSPVAASGLRFAGLNGVGPESSASGTQASASNYPLLQLHRLDNEQMLFMSLDSSAGFSGTTFTSTADWSMPPGPALATVITNGIPSVSRPTLVCDALSEVSISLSNAARVCGGAASGGTLTVADVGGGVVAHQWGYRTTPGGIIAAISGQVGASYTLASSDFDGPGVYYIVAVSTPLCGAETVSNEVTVTINSTGPTATSTNPIYVGGDLQLDASPVPGGTFSWTGPNGYSSTERSPLIQGVTTAASGTYSVTSTIDSCTSAPSTTEVYVNPRTLSIASPSMTEGNAGTANLGFLVTLSEPSASTVTVNYATRSGTATSPHDFIAATGTVAFPAGTTTRYIWIRVVGDLTGEATESFHVDLSSASGARIVVGDGIGTVLDNDVPRISVADVSVVEGDSGTVTAVFDVTLSLLSDQTVTVHYATAAGTATSGSDFVATSGDLAFGPRETLKTVSVEVIGDSMDEPAETFGVVLSSPVNATILRNGTGTIEDDDVAPQVSVGDVSLVEGNFGTTNAVFSVTLSAPSGNRVSVSYSTSDGTALAGSDYTSKAGSLFWSAGSSGSQTVVVSVINDLIHEPTEEFYLNLSAPVHATISRAQGVGTVADNDEAWPVLTVSDPTLVEADSGLKWVAFTLSMSKPVTVPVLVTYATTDGTAVAGSDYVARTGSVSFGVGDTSKLVYVYTIGDTVPEETETFNLTITGGNQITFGDPGVCTIVDND